MASIRKHPDKQKKIFSAYILTHFWLLLEAARPGIIAVGIEQNNKYTVEEGTNMHRRTVKFPPDHGSWSTCTLFSLKLELHHLWNNSKNWGRSAWSTLQTACKDWTQVPISSQQQKHGTIVSGHRLIFCHKIRNNWDVTDVSAQHTLFLNISL